MEKIFEVARIALNISKLDYAIKLQNGRGKELFATFEEAKDRIKSFKAEQPSAVWPYVIIKYISENGRIVYIEYTDSCLEEKKL